MLAAILSFLGSLASALPKALEMIRDWRVKAAADADKQAKDERNRKAIDDAVNGAGR